MIEPIYLDGDATKPVGDEDVKIISHVVNNRGGFGRGFVTAISKVSRLPELEYRKWFKEKIYRNIPFTLGKVQYVGISKNIRVANMLAQDGYKSIYNPVPLVYYALEQCLWNIHDNIKSIDSILYNMPCPPFNVPQFSVHIPYLMGCGYAGGNWQQVLDTLNEVICKNDINLYIYKYSEL